MTGDSGVVSPCVPLSDSSEVNASFQMSRMFYLYLRHHNNMPR